MSAYNKAFAGILSVLVARAIMHWFGIDLQVAGLSQDVQTLALMAVVAAEAAWTGFWVWLIPNVKRILHIDVDVKANADAPQPVVVSSTGDGTTTVILDPGPSPRDHN